jgi:ketosteroid isomerase-like protein
MTKEIADRLDVMETCTRMAWHADQREWDSLREVFADQVELDYTSLNGGTPVALGRDDLVAAWAGVLGRLTATSHLVANHLVSVDGDTAVCTAAFQATHLLPNAHGGPLWTLGGHYRFALVRTDGGWRISGVVMTAAWADGNQHVIALAAEPDRERP